MSMDVQFGAEAATAAACAVTIFTTAVQNTGETANFVYRPDGTFHIEVDGEPIRSLTWQANDADAALRAYLRFIS